MTFSDQSAISDHYDTAHAQSNTRAPLPPRPEHPDAKYPCEVCGRKFTQSRYMRLHMGTVHGVGEANTFQCNVCAKICTQKSHLKTHLSVMHGIGDVKTFQCDVCSRTFNDKSNLKRHLSRKHKIGNSNKF